jgi:hypothetical protein
MTTHRPLPMGSKGLPAHFAQRSITADQAAANSLARSLGCRVIEKHSWPIWSFTDTMTMLVRWTILVEEKRDYLGRPLRRELMGLRSDWADIERQLRVPLAHLAYNATIHKLSPPNLVPSADVDAE